MTEHSRPSWQPATAPGSFVTQYVQYGLMRTDAPPEAHELMAVGGLSALAGPGPRLAIATAPHGWRLVLWTMYVANSTRARKTTVLELLKDVLEAAVGTGVFIEWEGSTQGLIQRLQDRAGKTAVYSRDEFSGLVQQMNRVGGHLGNLAQLLIRCYDGGVVENIRTRKRGTDGALHTDTDRVVDPFLVTLAASTYDNLMERATIDNVIDGFLARFIFYTGEAHPQPVRELTPAVTAARNALVTRARQMHERSAALSSLHATAAVLRAHWELEEAWAAEAAQSERPSATGPTLKRLAESVLRVSALLAIEEADSYDVCIAEHHFVAARRMGERWKGTTLQVIRDLGATDFLRKSGAVLATVRRFPDGLRKSDLYRAHRGLRERDFAEILKALEQQEEIVVRSARGDVGRPAIVIYPAPPGDL